MHDRFRESRLGKCTDRFCQGVCRIVDDDVDGAKSLDSGLHKGAYIVERAHVARDSHGIDSCLAQRHFGLGTRLGFPTGYDHTGPHVAEPLCDRPSDTPGAASDNCYPTIETKESIDVTLFLKAHGLDNREAWAEMTERCDRASGSVPVAPSTTRMDVAFCLFITSPLHLALCLCGTYRVLNYVIDDSGTSRMASCARPR